MAKAPSSCPSASKEAISAAESDIEWCPRSSREKASTLDVSAYREIAWKATFVCPGELSINKDSRRATPPKPEGACLSGLVVG